MKKAGFLYGVLFALSGMAAPNPAYEFCVNHGGTIETRADSRGDQFGICMFSINGVRSECNQWEFLRGHCAPGQCLHWSVESRRCESRP